MIRGTTTLVGAILLSLAGCGGSGGNNSAAPGNAGAGTNLAAPAPGVATGTEWGVWASAAGGQWSDPCAIEYAAAQVAGNRYDDNPGYRRVRTRATQQDADLDIDQFGRYHRDQPDGVVKMTSCAASGAAAGNGNSTGATAGNADISGTWRGFQNYSYSIQQDGGNFTWTVGELQETATGTIEGDSVRAEWHNPRWSGSGSGTVERDAGGRAVRISWDNGVVFTR
jgi:hypothetical protein